MQQFRSLKTLQKFKFSSRPGPQPIQSGAPSRHEASLQAETLCCLGRVARPCRGGRPLREGVSRYAGRNRRYIDNAGRRSAQQSGGEFSSAVSTTRTGDAAVSKYEDAAEVQLGSCPGPQPIQSGAPSRHEASLQAKTLCGLGRVARPCCLDRRSSADVSPHVRTPHCLQRPLRLSPSPRARHARKEFLTGPARHFRRNRIRAQSDPSAR
jgi:hypothetical protein